MRWYTWLLIFAGLVLLPSHALADWWTWSPLNGNWYRSWRPGRLFGKRPATRQPCCPPYYIPEAPSPKPPDTEPTPPETPSPFPSPDELTAPPTTGAISAPSAAGTAGPATFAPNMFGDQLGGGIGLLSGELEVVLPPRAGALDNKTAFLTFEQALLSGSILKFSTGPGQTNSFIAGTAGGIRTMTFLQSGSFTQQGVTNPMPPHPISGITTASNSAKVFMAEIAQKNRALFNVVEQIEKDLNPNNPNVKTELIILSVNTKNSSAVIGPPGGPNNQEFPIEYDTILNTVIQETRTESIEIPAPAPGGVVGRIRISEDISPLPRDRFIFNYDYFNNTPLTPFGWDVNRFVFGFEKTFLDQQASIEVRLPFAATLESDVLQGMETTQTEFGDIRAMAKFLLFGNDRVNVAGGMAITMPTASDTRVFLTDQLAVPVRVDDQTQVILFQQREAEIVRIENQTVLLTPYLGALFTPNRRLFAQTWMAFEFDTRGNPVYFNPKLQQLVFGGRWNSQTLLQLDGQLGYWLLPPDRPTGFVRGLAPFIELHYNTTLGDPDVVSINNNQLTVEDTAGNRDELNLSAGFAANLGDRTTVAFGAVVPLSRQDDRNFDYQIGVRANVFFGPTLSARQRISAFGP